MAPHRRSDRQTRSLKSTARLGVEGLEPRLVLSGMPIDLPSFGLGELTRLSGGRLPPVEGGDPVVDVEAAGFSVSLASRVPNGLPVRALIIATGADGRPVPFRGERQLSTSDGAAACRRPSRSTAAGRS